MILQSRGAKIIVKKCHFTYNIPLHLRKGLLNSGREHDTMLIEARLEAINYTHNVPGRILVAQHKLYLRHNTHVTFKLQYGTLLTLHLNFLEDL